MMPTLNLLPQYRSDLLTHSEIELVLTFRAETNYCVQNILRPSEDFDPKAHPKNKKPSDLSEISIWKTSDFDPNKNHIKKLYQNIF